MFDEYLDEYLESSAGRKGREKPKRIYLRRGIPYTPQVFPPEPST